MAMFIVIGCASLLSGLFILCSAVICTFIIDYENEITDREIIVSTMLSSALIIAGAVIIIGAFR